MRLGPAMAIFLQGPEGVITSLQQLPRANTSVVQNVVQVCNQCVLSVFGIVFLWAGLPIPHIAIAKSSTSAVGLSKLLEDEIHVQERQF